MATWDAHTALIGSPKVTAISDAAFRLWVAGNCYAMDHLTDGFIPTHAVMALPVRVTKKLITELLTSHVEGKGPLWHIVRGGYQVHDWTDWNTPAKEIRDQRDHMRQRQRRYRQQRRAHQEKSQETSRVTGRETQRETRRGPPRETRRVSHATSDLGLDRGLGRGLGRDNPSEDPSSEKGREGGTRPRSGPLIARRKGWCAWEGAALSVHSRLHEDLRGRLELAGMDRQTADRELFAWYGATEEAWRGQDIGEDLFDFWRKRFREWRGVTATKSDEEIARERRRAKLQAEGNAKGARR